MNRNFFRKAILLWGGLCATFGLSNHVLAQTFSLPRADGSQIEYHIENITARDNKQDLLLILQGSDCNAVKTNPAVYEYAKIQRDSALLLIEKYALDSTLPRKSGARDDCPSAYLQNDMPYQRALDALTVIANLRHSAPWWSGKLTIIGGSSGALIAEQVAALTPEATHLVIFGFGSRWFKDDLFPSIENDIKSSAMPAAAQNETIAKILKQFEHAKHVRSVDKHMSGHSYAYWAELLAVDQLALLKHLKIPVLALHGDHDVAASPHGAKMLINTAKTEGVDITFIMYKGLDHNFKTTTGKSEQVRVLADIKTWLERE